MENLSVVYEHAVEMTWLRFVQFYTKFEEEGRMNDEQADLVKAHDGKICWKLWPG